MTPVVAFVKMCALPIAPAFVVTVNPPMAAIPVAGHPDPMPSPVPKFRAIVEWSVADTDLKINRVYAWIEHRTEPDQS